MRLTTLLITMMLHSSAWAYGFMLRHDYTSCGQCHVDPSGGSVLTPYGRAQSELLLRTRYGKASTGQAPGPEAQFLFGLLSRVPDTVMLGGDARLALLVSQFQSARVFPMQADFVGAVTSETLTVSVSLGVGSSSTSPARIVGQQLQLISRHHWVGYSPDEDHSLLIRAGRMALPFGLRIPEHTSWVRSETRTDLNVSQQHGLAVSYTGDFIRAEVMGIAGNMQLTPAHFRERGYSGFVEFSLRKGLTVGASSLLTHADADISKPSSGVFRHAHGVFTRLSPTRRLVFSGEVDLTHVSRRGIGGDLGLVGLAQLDLELVQGLHVVATGEVLARDLISNAQVGLGGWGSVWWFFAPHSDVRVDLVTRRETDGARTLSLLVQLHFFL